MSIDTRTVVTTGTDRATGPAVPWATVLPLAAGMALVDGFWVTVMRGALGAVDPALEPLASWLRVSLLSLPMFGLGVLGAFTVVLRRRGPGPLTGRATIATTLLVSAAGSLVGVTWLVASIGYDAGLHAVSPGLLVIGRAVGYGTAILLVSNVILVAWVVAARGGRIDPVARTRTAVPPSGSRIGRTRGRTEDLRLLLLVALPGSLAIHATLPPEHLGGWPVSVVTVVSLVVAVVGVAALVLGSGARLGLALALVLALPAVVVVWVAAARIGLPYAAAEGGPQPVALADVALLALDACIVVLAVLLLRRRGAKPAPGLSAHVRGMAVLALVALTALGLAGGGAGWFDDYGGSGGRATPTAPHSIPIHR